MALLRDKDGWVVRGPDGIGVKTTTEGERKSRELRRQAQALKTRLHASNRRERMMRTAAEQLRVLDQRLGFGKGATKERARLNNQIAAEQEALKKAAEDAALQAQNAASQERTAKAKKYQKPKRS